MKQFIKNNFATIVFVLALLSLLKSCGDSRELQKLRKEVEVVKSQSATKEEIELLQNKVMFEFLLYEDDIDNKKASISDIKNKIYDLEKKQTIK